MRKTLAVLLAALMLLALAACGGKQEPDPTPNTEQDEPQTSGQAAMSDGIYELENNDIGMKVFVRFNENNTYYGYYFDGGVTEAGTYELLDEALDYDAGDSTGTAPKTMVLTSYQGAEQRWAYDDTQDKFLGVSIGGMMTNRILAHNAEYAYDPATDELPITVCVYYADNNAGASLTLYHDRTFVDYTGDMMDEGTWEKSGDAYTLTSTENAGETYTLTVSGATADYDKSGAVLKLTDAITNSEVSLINTFLAEDAQVGLPMSVDVRIDCYSDGTCKTMVYVEQVDADLEVDSGTYTVADVFNYTFSFETAGEIAGEPDFASATESGITVNVPYKADVTALFMDSETPMSIDLSLAGTASESTVPTGAAPVELANTFLAEDAQVGLPMGVDVRIDCYSDGTCKTMVYVEQVDADLEVDSGTYTVADMFNYTFHFETAGEIASIPDYASATESGINVSVPYKADVTALFMDAETPMSIDLALDGAVTIG